ncbi:hypothetical protein JDXMQMMX_CDS56 [Acinetobacter phage vB_AbaM_AB4P2]|nr:hypothetical protein JDXMQMMX_CDS56 [Acinetobacter phage vB_AbaM_AB4P2]DAE34182.1 MAG TPA: hypothetical protein [Caudoviricetes sp.]DAM07432.1 MAG TPA: hypothetical protein [Caudoviricetes sp.]
MRISPISVSGVRLLMFCILNLTDVDYIISVVLTPARW